LSKSTSCIGGLDIATALRNSNSIATVIWPQLKPWDNAHSSQTQPRASAAQLPFSRGCRRLHVRLRGMPPIFLDLRSQPPAACVCWIIAAGGAHRGPGAGGVIRSRRAVPKLPSWRHQFSNLPSSPVRPGYSIDNGYDNLQDHGISLTVPTPRRRFWAGSLLNDSSILATPGSALAAEPEFRSISHLSVVDFTCAMTAGCMVADVQNPANFLTPSGGPAWCMLQSLPARSLRGTRPSSGYSSGQSSAAMEEARDSLPHGFRYEWTGTYVPESSRRDTNAHLRLRPRRCWCSCSCRAHEGSISVRGAVRRLRLEGSGGGRGWRASTCATLAYDIYTHIGIVGR